MNCSQIYIGVDIQLSESKSKVFSVELISDSDVEYAQLKSILKRDFIYYLAPHTGCGCGWDVLHTETEYDELSKQSLESLKVFLKTVSLNQTVYLLASNQFAVGDIPGLETEVNTEKFIASLGALRPKYGDSLAKLYLLKS